MVTANDIRDVLKTIPDPEMPISIVDLGIVENVHVAPDSGGARVRIDILPTFVGCPALPMIEDEIRKHVARLPNVAQVSVRFLFDPPWSVDRITEAGRKSLREHGVTVPACEALTSPERERGTAKTEAESIVLLTVSAEPRPVACPFCDSESTRVESAFGPTRCRMIYYCEACRNSFEHLKRV